MSNLSNLSLPRSSHHFLNCATASSCSRSSSYYMKLKQLAIITSGMVHPLPGEGLAFLIAPNLTFPQGSEGQYLGLTNAASDGNPPNHLLAIELDTYKQSFDPDDNVSRQLDVFTAEQLRDPKTSDFVIRPRPTNPILTSNLNLKDIVEQKSYFSFFALIGSATHLNCLLRWNLTVENLSGVGSEYSKSQGLKIGLGVGVPVVVVLLLGLGGLVYYVHKSRKAAAFEPNILGALKSLPGTPREFEFKELKKAN
ncbi:PREDICTED: probable L-type lectin-domain containing receptor kinase S.5 [Prunus mume]|uniref:Probable L-type lectin-domain containing receptor kinase S.5 n=1 Tax=Prunus mume TaxID=102107 RepID=A0ABM0NQ86_PRUMU|nr:PREDICTED: probable L-type lectin-domain containing receptor kinase S.5 [Prunus mume]